MIDNIIQFIINKYVQFYIFSKISAVWGHLRIKLVIILTIEIKTRRLFRLV